MRISVLINHMLCYFCLHLRTSEANRIHAELFNWHRHEMKERCLTAIQGLHISWAVFYFMRLERQAREAITLIVSPVFISTGAKQNNVKGQKRNVITFTASKLGHIRLYASQQHLWVMKEVWKPALLKTTWGNYKKVRHYYSIIVTTWTKHRQNVNVM